ncbi:MAG: site-specific DNA-methyltransferase [Prevotellaceae bacterium]|nr:site-specific DNA-methyltransferase [Prevotellaceae bacterium]
MSEIRVLPFKSRTAQLLSIKEASEWASNFTGRNVTPSNISYLIQYGRIQKMGENGSTKIALSELSKYYQSFNGLREVRFKQALGEDLNWALSFDQYKESETTKHVHRLHPYKGKFIPQLVEYFLDSHIDNFKTEVYFHPEDIVLDPFSGSGTTMVQACELNMHAIGIDVSAFNALIGNCKVSKYDLPNILTETNRITQKLKDSVLASHIIAFEEELSQRLNEFNSTYFPVPEYKYRLYHGEIEEKEYGNQKAQEFLPIYLQLVNKYHIKLKQTGSKTFLDKWYSQHIREEIELVFEEIKKIKDVNTKRLVSVILSRTIRSCRATTHADLATLIEPVTTTYYCHKHGKICKPLFSILKWWESYTKDTIKRIAAFEDLRTTTFQYCITGDSRTIDILTELHIKYPSLERLVRTQKIRGIFSSPPYVGLIDYHEQHAYAYDLFGFERNDDLEIGPLFKGQKAEAKESYTIGVSDVLNNCKRYMVDDYNVFLVANDKYNLYPTIADRANMKIVNQFKRPVLNRTEKDKGAYSETIFHLKEK